MDYNCNFNSWDRLSNANYLFDLFDQQVTDPQALQKYVLQLFRELNPNESVPLALASKLICHLNAHHTHCGFLFDHLTPEERQQMHAFLTQLIKHNETEWEEDQLAPINPLTPLTHLLSIPINGVLRVVHRFFSGTQLLSKDEALSFLFYHALASYNREIAGILLKNMKQLLPFQEIKHPLLFAEYNKFDHTPDLSLSQVATYPLHFALAKGWNDISLRLIELGIDLHQPLDTKDNTFDLLRAIKGQEYDPNSHSITPFDLFLSQSPSLDTTLELVWPPIASRILLTRPIIDKDVLCPLTETDVQSVLKNVVEILSQSREKRNCQILSTNLFAFLRIKSIRIIGTDIGHQFIMDLLHSGSAQGYELAELLILKHLKVQSKSPWALDLFLKALETARDYSSLMTELIKCDHVSFVLVRDLYDADFMIPYEDRHQFILKNMFNPKHTLLVSFLASEGGTEEDQLLILKAIMGRQKLFLNSISCNDCYRRELFFLGSFIRKYEKISLDQPLTTTLTQDDLFSAWIYSLAMEWAIPEFDLDFFKDCNLKLIPIEEFLRKFPEADDMGNGLKSDLGILGRLPDSTVLAFLRGNIIPIDFVDGKGNTLLHSRNSRFRDQSSIIIALLEQGANPNLKNRAGRVPNIFTNDFYSEEQKLLFLEACKVPLEIHDLIEYACDREQRLFALALWKKVAPLAESNSPLVVKAFLSILNAPDQPVSIMQTAGPALNMNSSIFFPLVEDWLNSRLQGQNPAFHLDNLKLKAIAQHCCPKILFEENESILHWLARHIALDTHEKNVLPLLAEIPSINLNCTNHRGHTILDAIFLHGSPLLLLTRDLITQRSVDRMTIEIIERDFPLTLLQRLAPLIHQINLANEGLNAYIQAFSLLSSAKIGYSTDHQEVLGYLQSHDLVAQTLFRKGAPGLSQEQILPLVKYFFQHQLWNYAVIAFDTNPALRNPGVFINLFDSDPQAMMTTFGYLDKETIIDIMTQLHPSGCFFYQEPKYSHLFADLITKHKINFQREALKKNHVFPNRIAIPWLLTNKVSYAYPQISVAEFDQRAARLKKQVLGLWDALKWQNTSDSIADNNGLDPILLFVAGAQRTPKQIRDALSVMMQKVVDRLAWLGTSPEENVDQVFREYSTFLMDSEVVIAGLHNKSPREIAGHLIDIAGIELAQRCFTGYSQEMLQKRDLFSGKPNDLDAFVEREINAELSHTVTLVTKGLVHDEAQMQFAVGLRAHPDYLASYSPDAAVGILEYEWNQQAFISSLSERLPFEKIAEWLIKHTPSDFGLSFIRLRRNLEREEAILLNQVKKQVGDLFASQVLGAKVISHVYESRALCFHFEEKGSFNLADATRDIIRRHAKLAGVTRGEQASTLDEVKVFFKQQRKEWMNKLQTPGLIPLEKQAILRKIPVLQQTVKKMEEEVAAATAFAHKFSPIQLTETEAVYLSGAELKEILKIKKTYDEGIVKLSLIPAFQKLGIIFSLNDHALPSIACEKERRQHYNAEVLGGGIEDLSEEEMEKLNLSQTALPFLLEAYGTIEG